MKRQPRERGMHNVISITVPDTILKYLAKNAEARSVSRAHVVRQLVYSAMHTEACEKKNDAREK